MCTASSASGRETISFDLEKGELVITDGRMISSLGTLVPVMTMSGPADEREELVARFNAARGQWGLPPLPDPDLPTKPPVSDVPLSSSVGTDPLAGKPLRKPPPPKHPASVPQSPSPAPEPEAEVVVMHLMPKNPKDVKAPAVYGAAPAVFYSCDLALGSCTDIPDRRPRNHCVLRRTTGKTSITRLSLHLARL